MRPIRASEFPVRPRGRGVLGAGASALAIIALVASCDGGIDRLPLEPELPPDGPLATVTCTVDVRGAAMTCAAPEAQLPEGAQGALTVGGQGLYVDLASANACFEAGCTPAASTGIFQADVTVQNLIGQALGTTDGAAGHADGVRIFFHSGPTVTSGSGAVVVANGDGTGAFTGSNQPYFQYGGSVDDRLGADDILAPGEVSASKTWQWQLDAGVLTFEFSVYVWGEVQYPDGWIDVVPATQTLELGGGGPSTVVLDATVRDVLGREVTGGTLAWSSSDDVVATVDGGTGEVTAGGLGTATITVTDGTVSGVAVITVAQSVTDDAYPHTVTGNVGVNSADLPFAVADNDFLGAGATIAFAGWNGSAGTTEQGGDLAMTTSDPGLGQFTYDPPAGFTGTDQFIYVIGDDTATVALTVEDRVWFIDNNAAACTSVASGCGRLSSPFSSLAAFGTANTGTGNDPGDGDVVFLHESTSAYTGPLTLRAGQVLVGQDAAASLAAIAGLTPGASSEPFPAMTPADGTHATITGGSGGIVLGTNNTLRGLTVATTGGTAISGSAFGTLTLAGDVDVDASGGPALSLSNGAFSGAFRSVAADGGANGIVLSSTTGTFTVAGTGTAGTGGTIQNATDAGVSLTNTGPVELAWMTIQTNGGDGITGSTVAGFTLRQSTVSGNGDAIGDHGLHFTELTGTVRIDTTTVSGSGDDGVLVDNSSGTIDLTVIGSAFTDNATRHLAFEAAGSAGGAVTVADNDFSGGGSGILVIGEEEPANWSGTITYDIHDNRLSASGGVSILAELRESTSSATMTGHIRDNALGTTTVACNTGGPGIQVAGEGGGTHTVAVTGNTLRGCQQDAISAYAAAGSATLNLTVQSNGVTDVSFFGGFLLLMGSSPATNVVCLTLGSATGPLKNTLANDGLSGDYYLEQPDNATTLKIPGFTPPAGDPTADLLAFLDARNLAAGGGDAAGDAASVLNVVQGVASCPTP